VRQIGSYLEPLTIQRQHELNFKKQNKIKMTQSYVLIFIHLTHIISEQTINGTHHIP